MGFPISLCKKYCHGPINLTTVFSHKASAIDDDLELLDNRYVLIPNRSMGPAVCKIYMTQNSTLGRKF
jgi:hypothetical protein